jgi:hypothetical protein
MEAAIYSFIIMGVGVLLILIGVYVSLSDWKRKQRQAGGDEALAGLGWLAKLAEALKGHQLGMQLIILGIAVLLGGGLVGGIAAL